MPDATCPHCNLTLPGEVRAVTGTCPHCGRKLRLTSVVRRRVALRAVRAEAKRLGGRKLRVQRPDT